MSSKNITKRKEPSKRAHPVMKFISEKLKEQEQSVTWLAKKAKINRGVMAYYWRGERSPTLYYADKMLKVFNCRLSVDWLPEKTNEKATVT